VKILRQKFKITDIIKIVTNVCKENVRTFGKKHKGWIPKAVVLILNLTGKISRGVRQKDERKYFNSWNDSRPRACFMLTMIMTPAKKKKIWTSVVHGTTEDGLCCEEENLWKILIWRITYFICFIQKARGKVNLPLWKVHTVPRHEDFWGLKVQLHIFLQSILARVITLRIYVGEVKLSLCLTNKALRHEDVWGLDIDPHFRDLGSSWRWTVSFTPRPLCPRESSSGTHCIGSWVDSRAGLADMEEWKFLTLWGLEHRPFGRPTRSQSLYRVH
jgi:hypothetical protein